MMSDLRLNQLYAGSNHIHIPGHRGARGVMPENTLEGFRYTFGIGIQFIELDILMTADGVPVITHNPRLMPYSTRRNGQWLESEGPLIAETSFDELLQYDVGGLKPASDYGKRYPDQAFQFGQTVPRLVDLCHLVNEPEHQDVWLNIEIKSDPDHPENTPPIPKFVEGIIDVLRNADVLERCILQSFDWRVLHECARIVPQVPRSYLTYDFKPNAPMAVNIYDGSPWMAGLNLNETNGDLPALIAKDGGKIWSPYHEDLTEQDMIFAKQQGLIVNVWTVNEIVDIDRMIDLGVDGIISDYPGRVQRRLLDHKLTWFPPEQTNLDI
jgi:glycerophosphoryl diester phosphodiesterase